MLNIESSIFGFVASIFFITGSVSMSGKTIYLTTCAYYDFNKYSARNVSSQRAEYISGGLVLCMAFILQLFSEVLPRELLKYAPWSQWDTICVLALVALLLLLFSIRIYGIIYVKTYKSVVRELRKDNAQNRLDQKRRNRK